MSDGTCRLCGRRTKRGMSQHHLIPRQCHSNKWFRKRFTRETLQQTIAVCRDCHQAIHRFVRDHKQLGREYNTPEKLLEHPLIRDFVQWARRQR